VSPLKRFLLAGLAIYSFLAVVGLFVFRSPKLSPAYLEKHEAAHERYVEITTNPRFEVFRERPHLYAPDDPRHEQLAFVQAYLRQPEYQRERVRIEAFTLWFHLLNGGAFLVLVLRMGYRPVVDYLDKRTVQIRDRLETASQARIVSLHELAEVQAQADAWPHKEEELKKRADDAIDNSLVQIREEGRLSRIQLARETEDRKRAEIFRAAGQIKEEMVSEAVGTLEKRYATEATERELRQNVEQFVRLLELIT